MEILPVDIKKKPDVRIIREIINTLQNGGLIVAPSDTVYGLLVDAKNEKGVKKLIQFKNRPAGKPISVFTSDFSMIERLVMVNIKQKKILKELLPGPFTIILPSRHQVSRLLESEKGTLGIRLPDCQLITELVKEFGGPVTATSANLSGRPPHYSVTSLLAELPLNKKKLIDLILDGGKLPRNKPSTVIDLTSSKIKILRKGDLVCTDSQLFISSSEKQTQTIGRYLLQKYHQYAYNQALVFIIQGELGVGKTVMIKGIAKELGIDRIVSPTFVIYYEYNITNSKFKIQNSKFIHIDLYNIQESEEFKYLRIEKYIRKRNILCFEWGEKAGEIYEILQKKAKIIYVTIEYINEKERKIQIKS